MKKLLFCFFMGFWLILIALTWYLDTAAEHQREPVRVVKCQGHEVFGVYYQYKGKFYPCRPRK
jgi:hypothetical protein